MTAQRQESYRFRLGSALFAAALALALGMVCPARAATTQRVVVDRTTGLAVSGFDPVAYFTDHEPRPGDAEFELTLNGVVWRFCNASNRSFFAERPDVYAPQFGGYDPVGVARGVPLPGSALVWIVVGQRLYLFDRDETRAAFASDPERYIEQAKAAWPGLQQTLAE